MVAVRTTQLDAASASFADVTWPPEAVVGDRVFALVFGGNQVTGYFPTGTLGWKVLAHVTGQEAQGQVLTKVISQGDLDDGDYHLDFDGSDPHRIVTIVAEGNCGYQLPTSARDGSAGADLPAYDQPEGTPALSDEVLFYFVGARNATDLPTSDLGTLVQSYSGTHTTSCWQYTVPGAQVVANTLGIPERSGHYRAVLRLFDWVEGPWHEDADVEVVGVDGHKSTDKYDATHVRNETWFSGAASEPTDTSIPRDVLAAAAWAGVSPSAQEVETTADGLAGVWSLQGNPAGVSQNQMIWTQQWVAVQRKEPADPVDSTAYPGAAPDASVDIEWEPTTTPESFQLELSVDPTGPPGLGPAVSLGGPDTVGYIYLDGVTTSNDGYRPSSFLPQATIVGMVQATELAFSDEFAQNHYLNHTFDLGPGGVGTYVAGTIVDAVTMTGDSSLANQSWARENPAIRYVIQADMKAVLRPRYRFLFDPLTGLQAPPRRVYPRPVTRAYPRPPFVQNSGRTGSSAIL